MTSDPHLFIIPKDLGNVSQLKLFNYCFNNDSILFGITSDCSNLYKIVQIGSSDKNNSWFYGNSVIEDGRMFGLVPILKGWIFFDLFSKCSRAKSLFLTIETVLHDFDDNEIILEMFTNQKGGIESFLKKLMPSQINLEGDLEFRYDELIVCSNLQNLFQNQNLSSNELPDDFEYFMAKWNRFDSMVVFLDNLQFYLSSTLFSNLCKALNTSEPEKEAEIKKRLKVNAENMVVSTIKMGCESRFGDENVFAPSEDYTKYSSINKSGNGLGKPKHVIQNNTTMDKFFKPKQK